MSVNSCYIVTDHFRKVRIVFPQQLEMPTEIAEVMAPPTANAAAEKRPQKKPYVNGEYFYYSDIIRISREQEFFNPITKSGVPSAKCHVYLYPVYCSETKPNHNQKCPEDGDINPDGSPDLLNLSRRNTLDDMVETTISTVEVNKANIKAEVQKNKTYFKSAQQQSMLFLWVLRSHVYMYFFSLLTVYTYVLEITMNAHLRRYNHQSPNAQHHDRLESPRQP